MPIVTSRTKRLSPLEENPVDGRQRVMEEVALVPQEDSIMNSSGRLTFIEIGTTILTARSCNSSHSDKRTRVGEASRDESRPVSLQECEIFQAIQPKSLALMKAEMERLWDRGIPMVIEVKGQDFPTHSQTDSPESLLLEQWTLQVVPRRSQCTHSPIHFLHQAVSSFLHFSQIRSWMVASEGSLPFQLLFRVCAPGEDGEQFKLHQPVEHCFPLAVIHEHYTLKVVVRSFPRLKHIPFSIDGVKKHNTKSISKPTAMTRKIFSSGSLTCPSIDDLTKRTAALHISPQQSSADSNSITAATTTSSISTENLSPTFPFSPPQPSPMSPKLLSGLADVLPYSRFQGTISHEESPTTESNCPYPQSFCFDTGCASHQAAGTDPHEEPPRSKPNQGRLTYQQRAESCSYPVSLSGVCPPSASSPIPFARKTANEKRRSLAINIKRPIRPPMRSNSAPSIVPSLYLLGTFEESVLNGRIQPCGHVDGFIAELGASGSFCPRHVTLPVTASFFSLSEHGGTSPYLGQIDLTGVGKRGYHVPKKGTVQVTLLNPNKTVVKIYFVKYDFSDMPPNSHTFLRQKTLSRPYHGSPVPAIPALHYLIHLRFLCSKSGHLYLHRNIRLIFACRAPDTDPDLGKVSLYVTTEGPTDPKYCKQVLHAASLRLEDVVIPQVLTVAAHAPPCLCPWALFSRDCGTCPSYAYQDKEQCMQNIVAKLARELNPGARAVLW